MSDIIACRKCGKLFNYMVGVRICPNCKKEQEEKFAEVKKYIREHKGANIKEVCEECDVEGKLIEMWIRQERLQFSEESGVKVPCESCGKMITGGKICSECRNKLAGQLDSMMKKDVATLKAEQHQSKKSGGAGMHYLHE